MQTKAWQTGKIPGSTQRGPPPLSQPFTVKYVPSSPQLSTFQPTPILGPYEFMNCQILGSQALLVQAKLFSLCKKTNILCVDMQISAEGAFLTHAISWDELKLRCEFWFMLIVYIMHWVRFYKFSRVMFFLKERFSMHIGFSLDSDYSNEKLNVLYLHCTSTTKDKHKA